MKASAAWLAALLAVLFVWRARVDIVHETPGWNRSDPQGLLKSDPALLYWFTERIAENGGRIPDDFAHTTAVQWPDEVDACAEFPQAQVWLAARSWVACGRPMPLHEWCVALFGLLAALAGLGVFGLARELTGSYRLALVALGTWCLLPASWRTAGFVLLGEDLSFPAFVAHLWLLARAARLRTPAAFLVAGAALLAAMASWHAAGFFVAIEAGAFLAWYLRSGTNPLAVRGAWLVLVPFALGCLLEPMLRDKLQLLSLPMQIAAVLGALAWIERRRGTLAPLARGALALGLLAGAAGLALGASRMLGRGLGDYSHVFGLITAKLANAGQRPADPLTLPFEVRILWQGPFETFALSSLAYNLSSSLLGFALLLAVSLPIWLRGRGPAAEALLVAGGAVALLAAWLIARTAILPAALFPVASVVLAARGQARRPVLTGVLAAALLLVPPGLTFRATMHILSQQNTWYVPGQMRELRELLTAIRVHVPEGEPIAADEVNSTAILAHTGHPILVQPKYEWTASRKRLRSFREAATLGKPADLSAFLRTHRTRFLVYDWHLLWASRYQVGIAESVNGMLPTTALYQTMQAADALPGFRLLWKSGGDRYRIYELAQG